MFRPGNPVPHGGDRTAVAVGSRAPREHGQPRPEVEDPPRLPTAAERARTLVEGNSSALLVIPGLDGVEPYLMAPLERAVDPDGEVSLLLPAESPASRAALHAVDDELVAVLEITDVAPVAVAQRIRGRAQVAGWLTADRDRGRTGRLRLEVGEVFVDDLWGAGSVEPDEFARAAADPLAGHETELLQHLAAAHGDRLALLARLLDGHPGRWTNPRGAAPVPVALDRHGLRVRFTGADGPFDARFEFPSPVHGVTGLRGAMRGLFDAARDSCGGPATPPPAAP